MSDTPYGGPSPFYERPIISSPAVRADNEFDQALARLKELHTVAQDYSVKLTKEAVVVKSYRRALEDIRTWLNSQNDDLYGDYEEIDHILHGVDL